MERWCWVTFQCRGVRLIWIIVGQRPTALAVGAGGGGLDIFSFIYHFSFLSPSLWETAQYRLKYCLKGPLSPKQPTNQLRETAQYRLKYCLKGPLSPKQPTSQLRETAQYRLKYCLKGPLSPKQPTNQLRETAQYRLKYCLKGPLAQNNQPTNCLSLQQHWDGCLGYTTL